VVQITADGGPDCFLAGAALAIYASTPEKAAPLAQRFDQLIREKDDLGRLSITRALAAMDASVAGSLTVPARDTNPDIRAAALTGMARNSSTYSMVLEALRTDPSPVVKGACLRAFAANPREEALPNVVGFLNDRDLKYPAHAALVAITGRDFGTAIVKWQAFLAMRKHP
jgi:hypothetical protein